MVAQRGGSVSYERGTPVGNPVCREKKRQESAESGLDWNPSSGEQSLTPQPRPFKVSAQFKTEGLLTDSFSQTIICQGPRTEGCERPFPHFELPLCMYGLCFAVSGLGFGV